MKTTRAHSPLIITGAFALKPLAAGRKQVE
jgi:hypothetical protein